MKNTKKLLIILCAVTVLMAMMLSFTIPAAAEQDTVTAGQGTTLDEYLNMKKVYSNGFETKSSFGLANSGDLPGTYQALAGGIQQADPDVWGSVAPVYGSEDTTAENFYVIDYNYNKDTGADLYIQPKLGDLNNIEKTPIYGFVSEFDIAILSPRNPVYQKDALGRTVYIDADGNNYYEDENGVFYDSLGNEILSDGQGSLTLNAGTKDAITIRVSKIIERYEKGAYIPLGSNFSVGMYNTHTYKDGTLSLLSIDGKTEEIKLYTMKKENGKNVTDKLVYTFAPDEWVHIAVQYDADTMLTYVYVGRDDTVHADGAVGRKLVTTLNAIDQPENYGYENTAVYPLQFRLGCASRSGTVAMDNFLAYQGTSIHNPDLVSKYSDVNLFTFLASILVNEDGSNTATNSFQAYGYMEDMLPAYYDMNTGSYLNGSSAARAAVDLYLNYYNNTNGIMDTLKNEVRLENTEKFLYYVRNITDVTRTLDNVLERDIKITAAEKFLSSVGSFIIKNGDYEEAYAILSEAASHITSDENSNQFISYMNLFRQSIDYGASLNKLTAHYEKARACYERGISDYNDFYGVDEASYNDLKNALDLYLGGSSLGAADIIAQNTRKNNSERFINITHLMKNNSVGSWENDSAVIKNYWKLALDILLDNNYDADYDGLDDAMAIFESANAYFWAELQKEHIAILSAKVEEFNDAGKTYVEKAAICTYVDRYINVNERYMDLGNSEISSLCLINEAYKVQLGTIESDYSNLLVQNTIKFVNLMQYIELFTTYEEIKPLYEEATDYYYSMNVKSDTISEEEIALYVAKYENLRSWVLSTEADCEVFLAYSAILKTIETQDELYYALSECYACLDFLDETYAGIKAAKVAYDAAYAEYVGSARVVNNQIEQTANVTCALRGNWNFDLIVSYFKSLFN